MRTIGLVAMSLVALASVRPTLAATRLVPQEFPTIQAAVDASSPDDVILVAPGTYPESIRIDGIDRLTIDVQEQLGEPVVLDVRTFDVGIVAHDLDGLVIRGFTVLQFPAPSSFGAIVLDEPGAFGGGQAPLSRIVLSYLHVIAENRGIANLGATEHVVIHCSTIEVANLFAVGWHSGGLMRVKFSRIAALPGTSPLFAIVGNSCPAPLDASTSAHDRITDNRIEGPFRAGISMTGVTDFHAIANVIRLTGPVHAAGGGTIGISIEPGCSRRPFSSDVEVRANDVGGALVGLRLAGVQDGIVIGNSLGKNGSATSDFGAAIFLGSPSNPNGPSSCGLRVEFNDLRGLRSPRTSPAIRVIQTRACSPDNANVIDATNRIDLGRPRLGS